VSGTPQPDDHPDAQPDDQPGDLEVRDVPEESRYDLYIDGVRVGFMDYAVRGDTFTALHTEIYPAYGGRGLASRLVTEVLDNVRDTGMALRPLCPFVRRFLETHPEYDDLVTASKGT
jgi:predicted GNAT family acetyltransferase